MRKHPCAVGVVILAVFSLAFLPGCGGSSDPSSTGAVLPLPSDRSYDKTVTLVPFNDAWPSSAERLLDVGDISFNLNVAPQITVKYDSAPGVPYFVGAIKAQGLKPNFCYQLKLMGKPGLVTSSRAKPGGVGKPKPPPDPVDVGLWGDDADNTTNLALLQAGRWWNYRTEVPAYNTSDEAAILASDDYLAGWVAGYIYFGFLITDSLGNSAWSVAVTPNATFADLEKSTPDPDGYVPIAANASFHITGKDSQEIGVDSDTVTHDSVRPASSYGVTKPGSSTTMWFEKEPNDDIPVALPNGTHDVVLVLTEESFHSELTFGGKWATVFVSDWSTGTSPVSDQQWLSSPGSPITFYTGPPKEMTASTSVRWVQSHRKWFAEATVTVMSEGSPVPEAAVTMLWSGAYDSVSQGLTDGSGKVVFVGPNVREPALQMVDVTAVTKPGYLLESANSTLHAEASN